MNVTEPLAARMRPRSLDEVVGQDHLTREGSPLHRLIEGSSSTSVILWGPPGVGKTTLARLLANATGRPFRELSAVTAGVKDIRAVMEEAAVAPIAPVLFVDEVHRFSKTQQDALLPGVESGTVTLVAATTENPSFSLVGPLLSRSLLLTLRPLTDDDIRTVLHRALGVLGATLTEGAEDHLVRLSQGDARSALTALEAASGSDPITLEDVEQAVDVAAPRYDRDGDQHYDVISAFIKSIRGSDPDAALHWLARMLTAGEDPRFIARRLMILASEDVGLADPTALPTAVAAAQTVQLIGMPEAKLTLAHATIHLALAPKSNAVTTAIAQAEADVRQGLGGSVPPALRDRHYKGAERLHGAETVKPYVYPHDVPGGVTAQQYAPEDLRSRTYYRPTQRGAEKVLSERLEKLRRIVREGA